MILAGVYQIAGWTGLVVFRAVLIGIIFGCLFTIGWRRGLGMRRAAWLTLAAFVVSAVALGLRPQLIGMALFAIVLLLVTDRRAHPGRLLGDPGPGPGLGEHPRQLLPGAARRSGLPGSRMSTMA